MKIVRIYLKFGTRNVNDGYTYLGVIDEALLISLECV
jgi:hypothetical protein